MFFGAFEAGDEVDSPQTKPRTLHGFLTKDMLFLSALLFDFTLLQDRLALNERAFIQFFLIRRDIKTKVTFP